MSITSLAIRNLLRKPFRSAIIFLAMASITLTLFSLMTIYYATNEGLKQGISRLGADAMVVPKGFEAKTEGALLAGSPSEFYMKESVKERLREFKEIKEMTSQLFIISAPLACCSVSDTMLIGFEPDRDFTIIPWLRDRFKETLSSIDVIVGTNILSDVGGKIQFYGQEFFIKGKLEPTGMRFIDSSVFMPIPTARKMIAESAEKALKTPNIAPDEVSVVLLKFTESINPEEIAIRIEHSISDVQVILSEDILRGARKTLSVPLRAALFSALIQWVASILMISALFSVSILERTKECGILRAMGSRKRDILKIFLTEASIVSALGGLVGVISGGVFILFFGGLIKITLGMPFLMPSPLRFIVLGSILFLFSIASGVALSIYPALRVSKKGIHSAILG